MRFLLCVLISMVFTISGSSVMKAEAGMVIGPQIDIYIGPNDQEPQSVAYDSVNKRFLVTWIDRDDPAIQSYNMYGQLVNEDSSLFGDRIVICAGIAELGWPIIAFDPINQRFLVAWEDGRTYGSSPWYIANNESYGQFVNSDGSLFGSNFAIRSFDPLTGGTGVRGIAFDTILNRFLVLIEQHTGAGFCYYHDHHVYGQFVNSDGSLSGAYFPITDLAGPGSYYIYSCLLSYDINHGRFLITHSKYWHDFRGRLLNADGTSFSAEFTIPNSIFGITKPNYMRSISFDSINNRFLLLWSNVSQDGIYGRLINSDGALFGSEITVLPYPSGSVSVIFDTTSKKYLVVHNVSGMVFGQLLNPDGSLSGPTFNIASSVNGPPFLAGSASNFLAVWDANFGTGTGRDIYGKTILVLDDWFLYMTGMEWYEVIAPYNSTGAATASMILSYIREGWIGQNEIYLYAKDPGPFVGDLAPDEMDKVLGHFDPYDDLVSNSYDIYDSLPDGNPYQGYNYTVDTYDPVLDRDAMNNYMRDICHWMAYTVTKENWWEDGELVARPNTPAAIPIYGTYDHWVAVKGYSTSENPCPEPHTNPWNTPDFTVYGFWIKDPLISGIGQDAYVTAAECESTYFHPLSTGDAYDGLLLQVAEPPAEMSTARIEIPQPAKDVANLEFVGVKAKAKDYNEVSLLTAMSFEAASMPLKNKSPIKKQNWRDLMDPHLLTNPEAVAAFEATKMRKPILVNRLDIEDSNYFLVPFDRQVEGKGFLTSGVIILDADKGYFKEASWTSNPEIFLKVNKGKALKLIREYLLQSRANELKNIPKKPQREYLRQMARILQKYQKLLTHINNAEAELVWEPNNYSISPYKPYWKIDVNGYIIYVTQEAKVIFETDLDRILGEIEASRRYLMNF